MIDPELLLAKFVYDPDTGHITRRSDGSRADNSLGAQGYRRVSVSDGKYRSAHRVAYAMMTGAWPSADLHVHHVNADRTDNRWGNLQLVTPRENIRAKAHREDSGITPTASGNGWYVSWGTTVSADIETARKLRTFVQRQIDVFLNNNDLA